jgi:cyclic beta-1,2-glucan synthetase
MAEFFARMFGSPLRKSPGQELPFAGELYSAETLEEFAAKLAAQHRVSLRPPQTKDLLARLSDNERVLIDAYQTLADAIHRERTVSPAAEWLVDNFHIVEEQLREIRQDLPQSYYRKLPKLSDGDLTGYPRIYAVALGLVSHTDCRLDLDTLKRFIRAYQREAVLSIGELWAVAITLRLTLVENLRRLAERTVTARQKRNDANAVADELSNPDLRSDEILSLLRGRVPKPLDPAFLTQLTKRLHDQEPALSVVLEWVNLEPPVAGQSSQQVIQDEHQRQATAQVTVANIITSMRLLSTLDWRDFFESVSLIDPLLRSDPAGAYGSMDFVTRDRYRHVIENIASRTGADELAVAQKALDLACQIPATDQETEVTRHVGYYLIGDGVRQLETVLEYHLKVGERALRSVLHHPTSLYFGALTTLTTALVGLLIYYAIAHGADAVVVTTVVVLSLIPVTDLATSLVNRLITSTINPQPLPKMNTVSGVSKLQRTMVVVPTMLIDEEFVREQVERLEVHYLSNQAEHIFFGLLTDFTDAATEHTPNDEALLQLARDGIAALNARNAGNGDSARFHLFHRCRKWNESEGKWIGWERKRGKLSEFNRLLRGAKDTSFIVTTADSSLLSSIQYIITLDSDTQLPHGAARRLLGTICHPLNRPHFDPEVGRVTRGYGILQPRISVSLVSASRSLFARSFAGNIGVDPYTTAVSDVYQDLFAEGSYIGKGLYHVDSFESALAHRIPDNSLLSHDLFEGLFARTALVTDVELFDDYPDRYDTYAHRQSRWARGDWQVASWMLPRVRDQQGQKVRNRLPLISRWKILDNLRRSLVTPSLVLWFGAALTFLPGSPLVWTIAIFLTIAFPVYAPIAGALSFPGQGTSWKSHLSRVWRDLKINGFQLLLNITFITHQSYLMTDAIVRTLYRKLISRRHLLEWISAAEAGRSNGNWGSFVAFMWPAITITTVITGLVLLTNSQAIVVGAPFLLLWFLSPYIAYKISKRRRVEPEPVGINETNEARLLARRLWRFFETFVGEEDHWLPPDNFQEDPAPVVAHRTSPTNIGLLLLSTVAARDFGYLGLLELVERLELTFTTVEKLPRFHGHFFNWYDTHSLEPLTPQYVSTVDGGNLAGHLIVIKQTCHDFLDQPIFSSRTMAGLRDTLTFLAQEVEVIARSKIVSGGVSIRELHQEITACEDLVRGSIPQSVLEWHTLLSRLSKRTATIQDMVDALTHEYGVEPFAEIRFWAQALTHEMQVLIRDIQTLAPWAAMLDLIKPGEREQYGQEIRSGLENVTRALSVVPSPARISAICEEVLVQLSDLRCRLEEKPGAKSSAKLLEDLFSLTRLVEAGEKTGHIFTARTISLARLCERFMNEMDFAFLFDERLKVLTVGYNVIAGRRDESFYDLLASEARLASFVAIASGDVPQEHWFRLGRQLAAVNGNRALISWSASMFEYLMPLLVMRNYDDTLLAETYRTVVAAQINYGRDHGVPWGVSESAYNARNPQLTYQYGPFGVPGMGLKRGLSENVVVAPYATLLGALIAPRAAMKNLQHLKREGALGRFGFYDAIDYTAERLAPDQKKAVVQAFMTHHQGMSLVALDNLLHANIMQTRFHSDALVKAHELLLQERIPHGVPATHPRAEEIPSNYVTRKATRPLAPRRYNTADVPAPRTHLLSNGTYSVMLTTAGAGYSKCRSLAVTRWREDTTRDNWGTFIYLRDVQSGAVWSAGYQPVVRTPQLYDVNFSEHKAQFCREDAGLRTCMEIVVSPEDNAEVRRVSITNQSSRKREIEVTSYAEVVLAPAASDLAHPAFSNLFVETEFIPEKSALVARRRPRSENDEVVWAIHVVASDERAVGTIQHETDRSRFIGRGRSTADPVAVVEDRVLSSSVGAVLDPIFSLRQQVQVEPGQTARLCFTIAVSPSREEVLKLGDKYHDLDTFEREARLAWTKSQVQLRYLDIDLEEAQLFQQFAGHVLYWQPGLRPRANVLALNRKSQADLWRYGISGDLPIVVVRISEARDLRIVRQILRAHEYLRLKNLALDLVILNDRPSGYVESLQHDLLDLVGKSGAQHLIDKAGGIFLRRSDVMPDEDRILLHTAARLCLVTERGSLEDQLSKSPVEPKPIEPFIPSQALRHDSAPPLSLPELSFFNGLGGFNEDGSEYITILREGQWTPAPWLNVIANSEFGFQVSESGAGPTWSVNSHENRLTPWSNDAVSDPPGEVLYIHDEETGATWTSTPLPIRETTPYIIRHGQGYSTFEHTSHGIAHELLLFVPIDASVKVSRLRLHNMTNRRRSLSVTSYHQLVLGVNSQSSSPFLITEIDQSTGAIFARNPYHNEFAQRVAFIDMSESKRTVTCDRQDFLGRNGSTARPAALAQHHLSGAVGAGLDPCAAIQTKFELAPNEAREIVVLLGQTASVEEARRLTSHHRQLSVVEVEVEKVKRFWDEILNTIQIRTPDDSLNMMMNRWLLYQTLSCRLWARSAFYQSGGAYGFRDQLQDVLALLYSKPEFAREHILRAAGRQFIEGDVQHWWHPQSGRGVRTRFADDLLWLPYVTACYIEVTGDRSVLDETVAFLAAPPLASGQTESFTQPNIASEVAPLFEHCARALDRSLGVGVHGLPLMGSGDWNDGMNRVGWKGKGESVWLAWFLCKILETFVEFCEVRGEFERAVRYREHVTRLKSALEEHAWDGDWYVRAFFDDGTPVGSARNEECVIDSIAQSWAVISGAANPERARQALAAAEQHLVRREDGLMLLLSPPFDKSSLEPGYIKGYLPGVRENGGQYTHAALWMIIAYAILGDGERATELLAMLNPINHAANRAGLQRYKVEPYVAPADVYAAQAQSGRGGWTWYTGAASWMYRAALEFVLGFKLVGDKLTLAPCIPRAWREYEITYRKGTTLYRIKVANPHGVNRGFLGIRLDGVAVTAREIKLVDDQQSHEICLVLGEEANASASVPVSVSKGISV